MKDQKHELEELQSWNLYQERQAEEKKHRSLKKKKKNKIPEPANGSFHGIMIDAGSQGTRVHLYEFPERRLNHKAEIEHALNGFKLSYPTTNSRWTNRLRPGIDHCASVEDDEELLHTLKDYLRPLIDFCKKVLVDKKDDWEKFPIYLKATGGVRTLPTADRIRLMGKVRQVFNDKSFNPFSFENERARVISGEEEAIYGWTAVNYIKGTLLQASEGIGTTVLNPKLTYGMIEMGGASTQIGFFEPNGDVMANLFKLQIGGARHWNIYVHSFLYFGINGAWERLNARLYDGKNETARNPCLPQQSEFPFTSWIHMNENGQLLPRSNTQSTTYTIKIYNDQPDFEICSELTRSLLHKEANVEWVDFSHDGDSSFAGVYQPPLPTNSSSVGGFLATSNFADVWAFLNLEQTSPINMVREKAKMICEMDMAELMEYNANLKSPADEDEIHFLCFRSIFVFEILYTGYGFPLDYQMTAVDVVKNQKLGWALGSILYEINTLPWEFGQHVKVVQTTGMANPSIDSTGEAAPYLYTSHQKWFAIIAMTIFAIACTVLYRRRRRNDNAYQEIVASVQ